MFLYFNIGSVGKNTMAKRVNSQRARKTGFCANVISIGLPPLRSRVRVRLQKSVAVLRGLWPNDSCAAPVGSRFIFHIYSERLRSYAENCRRAPGLNENPNYNLVDVLEERPSHPLFSYRSWSGCGEQTQGCPPTLHHQRPKRLSARRILATRGDWTAQSGLR